MIGSTVEKMTPAEIAAEASKPPRPPHTEYEMLTYLLDVILTARWRLMRYKQSTTELDHALRLNGVDPTQDPPRWRSPHGAAPTRPEPAEAA